MGRTVTMPMYDKYTELGDIDIIFISDSPPDYAADNIHYYPSNELLQDKFHALTTINRNGPVAWDKAFWFLKQSHIEYSHVWLIEDDCYLNKDHFVDYIKTFKNNQSDILHFGWRKTRCDLRDPNNDWIWPWVDGEEKYFPIKQQASSLNVITRLSHKLVDRIISFHEEHQQFLFHELLFASIANKYGMVREAITNKKIFLRAIHPRPSPRAREYTMYHPFKGWYNQ